MYGSRSISVGLAALLLGAPGVASAECQRAGTLICGNGAPRIASDAPLEVSRGGDFAALPSGGALKGGDRVLVGAANAKVSLGPSCQAEVGAGSLVSIQRTGGQTCVSVTEQVVEKINPLLAGAAVAGGAAALAVGIALGTGGGGNGGFSGGGGGRVSSR